MRRYRLGILAVLSLLFAIAVSTGYFYGMGYWDKNKNPVFMMAEGCTAFIFANWTVLLPC